MLKHQITQQAPVIDFDGVLDTPVGWTTDVPTPEANKTLWVLVGHGKPSNRISNNSISWSGVYTGGIQGPPGVDGVKGDKGDGAGYYVFFRYVIEGTSAVKPPTSLINKKGVLSKPDDWGLTPEEAAISLAAELNPKR